MQEAEVLFFGIGGFSYGNQSISVREEADGSYVAYCRKAYSIDDVEEHELTLQASDFETFLQAAEELGIMTSNKNI